MKRFLKFTLLVIFGIFLLLNLFILFSGKWYVYTAVSKTYFRGQGGPDIYDLDLFPKREIKKSSHPKELVENILTKSLPKDIETELEGIKTTSFLVMRNDTILFEKYWGDHTKETISNSFSAVKSFVSVLIGIAIDEGKISSIEAKVGDYLPEFKKGKLSNITIHDLLNMSSGLSWSESGKNPFSNNAEAYYGSELEKLVLSQTVERKPGIKFNYQSGNTELLALIIEAATGKNVSTYLDEKIWSKIGTSHDAYWSLDHKNGQEKAFCCFYATTRDFAKFGLLILNNGVANGKQIIPSSYMKLMFKNDPLKTVEKIPNTRYGLQWWTYNDVRYARGILGQYIIIIPRLNMVIVRTGHKREPDLTISSAQGKDKAFMEKNAAKVGHPKDLFTYLRFAEYLSSLKK